MAEVNPASKNPGRVIQLDFVRGLAILAVMVFHFRFIQSQSFPARMVEFVGKRMGWIGVDLFFVLSGFLVGGLLVQELLKSNDIRVRRFLVRRALKIWPAYYTFVLFQLVLRRHPWRSFFWQNMLNIQNYTGTSLHPTWSLAVEEHFYLVLPPLLWLLYKKSKSPEIIPWILGLICIAVLIGRCITVYALGWGNPQWKTHARIDGLLFGVILSWIFYSDRARFDRLLEKRLLLLAIFILGLLFDFCVSLDSPLMWSIGFTINYLSLGSLFLLVYQYRGRLTRNAIYKVIAWIGLYSYGIYLWHLTVVDPVFSIVSHMPAFMRWEALLFGQYAAAILLGVLMTKLVEFPMLRVRDRVFPRGQASLAPAQP